MHNVSSVGFVAPLIIGRTWGMEAGKVANAVALNGMRHLTLKASNAIPCSSRYRERSKRR